MSTLTPAKIVDSSVSIRLPREWRDVLAARAIDGGRTLSQEVRLLLAPYLNTPASRERD